jgi:putative PIN family toxin of toxin-antitoxin system
VRAVLDTNVFVSAAVTPGGVADRLLRLAALSRFKMIVSPKLLFEIQATAGKAYLADQLPGGEDLAVFLAQIWRVGIPSIDPALRYPLTGDADRTDDFVLALAQWNGALLVTGDNRLLKLGPPPNILTPREFLDMCDTQT